MAKIKVAIFGGGYNPIAHHEQIAKLVFEKTGMPVWLMPCFKHKFEKEEHLLETPHRWNMVMEVTNQYPENQMLAFDWEISREFDGSMWTAMEELVEINGDKYDFHIVIGMDNANIIETKWHNGDFLIQRFPFIVIERARVKRTATWFDKPQHQVIPFNKMISSSEIRECIAAGKHDFARRHLNSRVWDYIVTGRLYGYQGK